MSIVVDLVKTNFELQNELETTKKQLEEAVGVIDDLNNHIMFSQPLIDSAIIREYSRQFLAKIKNDNMTYNELTSK